MLVRVCVSATLLCPFLMHVSVDLYPRTLTNDTPVRSTREFSLCSARVVYTCLDPQISLALPRPQRSRCVGSPARATPSKYPSQRCASAYKKIRTYYWIIVHVSCTRARARTHERVVLKATGQRTCQPLRRSSLASAVPPAASIVPGGWGVG